MKKILIVSTVSRQFYLFEQGNIEVLKSLNFEIHGAANFDDANTRLDRLNIIKHPFDIQRAPFSLKNIKAYKQLKQIMKSEKFDAVHCHSPMGGVLARLAARSLGITPVIYTAHGFHFYKGAPCKNWLFYYPVEYFLAQFTDVLITINQEDFEQAQRFKAKNIVHIPGIGVEARKFNNCILHRDEKRKALGISNDDVVLLSIGELIKRKNHENALKALAEAKMQNIVYLICGKGDLEEYLKNLTRALGIGSKVQFLGFRSDIPEICAASDIFMFPSYQEGLPVSMMEAMSAGLPVICSKIRGNSDLIEDGKGGYLFSPDDAKGFGKAIKMLADDKMLRKKMGQVNLDTVKNYDASVVKEQMVKIYNNIAEVIV